MPLEEVYSLWNKWIDEWIEMQVKRYGHSAKETYKWVKNDAIKRQNNAKLAIKKYNQNVMIASIFADTNILVYPDKTAIFVPFNENNFEISYIHCDICGKLVELYEWAVKEDKILCNSHVKCHFCDYIDDTSKFFDEDKELFECPKCHNSWGDGGG